MDRQDLLEHDFSLTILIENPRNSPSLPLSSSQFTTVVMNGILSRKSFSFSYRKLPSQPLRLSVLKLDGSSFGNSSVIIFLCFMANFNSMKLIMSCLICFTDIVVSKMATIAEVKQAVQAVFSHMPKKGPGKISWWVKPSVIKFRLKCI